MSDKLLPCPFCGGKASFDSVPIPANEEDATPNSGGHFIECEKCNASTALVFPLKDDVTQELMQRWNDRTGGNIEADRRAQAIIDKMFLEAQEGMPGTPWRVEQPYVVELRDWAVTRIAKLKRQLTAADAAFKLVQQDCVNLTEKVIPNIKESADQKFKEHTTAVALFINELYAIMVDPCAEGILPVNECQEALIKAALRDRENSQKRECTP